MIRDIQTFSGDFSALRLHNLRSSTYSAFRRFTSLLGKSTLACALLLGCLLTGTRDANAQLIIDVTTSAGRQIPIAIVPFANELTAPQNITPVIINNLTRTGLFKMVNTTTVRAEPSEFCRLVVAQFGSVGDRFD
jgi:TolB amino-terminal domain